MIRKRRMMSDVTLRRRTPPKQGGSADFSLVENAEDAVRELHTPASVLASGRAEETQTSPFVQHAHESEDVYTAFPRSVRYRHLGKFFREGELPPYAYRSTYKPKPEMESDPVHILDEEKMPPLGSFECERKEDIITILDRPQTKNRRKRSWHIPPFSLSFAHIPHARAYAVIASVVFLLVGAVSFVSRGVYLQERVLGVTNDGIEETNEAMSLLASQEYLASSRSFREASAQFDVAARELTHWAGILTHIDSPLPFLTRLTSGKNALEAGKYLAHAGESMSLLMNRINGLENPLESQASLLDLFKYAAHDAAESRKDIEQAILHLDRIRVDDIPETYAAQFVELKNSLPKVLDGLESMEANTPVIIDMLGGNGPRKYLFLFQNNHELRATGGFIGSYGLLDIKDGVIREFFVDGIFNPDGQLKVDIVPPKPIQKVSAGWSLHDSNWFADFPISAEKAMFFYEKTGGPTVDGVIAFTPNVLQRLLEVTGPIDMPEYGVTVHTDNFIETIQYKVEVDYDKEENRPKRILADLMPILLERLFSVKGGDDALAFLSALDTSLREKDILLYSSANEVQSIYDRMGWSGHLRETSYDFLSVVHSNINGYKTDGVVDEQIKHHTKIDASGEIIDTVTITRRHNGGHTAYDWWNRVNADYMRVYVPKGSVLMSAKGHTREIVESPLDYKALGFGQDPLLSEIQDSLTVDPGSGTHIFTESDKTVFGNWVYVSPQESVTVEYTYALPFQLNTDLQELPFSLLAQKQPGTIDVSFERAVEYPENWSVTWKSSENTTDGHGMLQRMQTLDTDMFDGYVFQTDNQQLTTNN